MIPKAEDYDRFADYFISQLKDWDFSFVNSRYHESGFYSTQTQQMFSIWWAGVCAGRHQLCHKCGKPFRFTPICSDCGYIPILGKD